VRLNGGTAALAVLVFGFLGFMAVRRPWIHPWTPWQFVGVALAVPAVALFVLARIQLGRAFSVKAKASTLVTTGIYARIRNPIYVFGGLWTAGLLIFAHRPWWLLIFGVLIPLQRLRVRKEEQVLEAKFGDTYREYKRKTWF
jgi:protein-S-isoprenylcysteine O-methyltransferase Ste14